METQTNYLIKLLEDERKKKLKAYYYILTFGFMADFIAFNLKQGDVTTEMLMSEIVKMLGERKV